MKTRAEYTCPLELTHDITKGKWKPIILWQLGKGTQSLSSLKKEINGITQKMLIEQLKELIEYGMAAKKSYEGYPLKVDYFLTPRGEKMLCAIEIMQEIGIEMMIEDDRVDFLKKRIFCSIVTKKWVICSKLFLIIIGL
ncbi:helix-turn-helix domain-containing protein [Anaerovorax odorimutans]|uniref:winged helix-turn-helix transcriptional regulator n=1 Tax=Anaerovorax odorimutans TaxID=109327 RepID=UPI002ED01651